MSVNAANVGKDAGLRRYLVTFQPDHADEGPRELGRMLGIDLAVSDGTRTVTLGTGHGDSRGVRFPELRAAIVLLGPDDAARLLSTSAPRDLVRTAEAIGTLKLLPVEAGQRRPKRGAEWEDDEASTWGLKAIELRNGSGRGVRVAFLDTGFGPCVNFDNGRIVAAEPIHPHSPRSTKDQNGHGTMCTGIACGNRTGEGMRFGVAYESEVVVCKVASAVGTSTPEYLFDGLQRALRHECHVASISFGMDRDNPAEEGFSEIAQHALSKGMLIVGAAGNDSPLTVVSPASARGVMAVGAIDSHGNAYPKSCPSGSKAGQAVDLAAPGVDVFVPVPDHAPDAPFTHRSGTSLAAPHVTGVAALFFERGYRAEEVLRLLTANVTALRIDPNVIGSGLLRAPRDVTSV